MISKGNTFILVSFGIFPLAILKKIQMNIFYLNIC